MNNKNTLSALALLFAATGCTLPALKAMPPTLISAEATRTTTPEHPNTSRPNSNLYARDGSVVGAQAPGEMSVMPETGQSAMGDEGGRWTLLERYQTALSEKEQLQFEFESMATALQQAETREAQLTLTIEGLRKDITDSASRVETLEGHNVELGARLTTAQIRRLQSEKLLLEAKLDWRRIQDAINTPQEAGAPTKSSESMPGSSAGPLGSSN